jgi:hypothetical protein
MKTTITTMKTNTTGEPNCFENDSGTKGCANPNATVYRGGGGRVCMCCVEENQRRT